MQETAYIGYTKRDGTIKAVFVHEDGGIEHLGANLIEYYDNISEVKRLIKSSILYLDEDEIEYYDDIELLNEDDAEYYVYDDKEGYINDMNTVSTYYLYEDNNWYVSKPNHMNFLELEAVLEEEY